MTSVNNCCDSDINHTDNIMIIESTLQVASNSSLWAIAILTFDKFFINRFCSRLGRYRWIAQYF